MNREKSKRLSVSTWMDGPIGLQGMNDILLYPFSRKSGHPVNITTAAGAYSDKIS
jgi:hypothetical protein